MSVSALAFAPANATVIGQETNADGFIGELFSGYAGAPFPGSVGWTVASDGESLFRPFGIEVDVSDAVSLTNPFAWRQVDGSKWTQKGTESVWYIPASSPGGPGCGAENEPTCEYVGRFISDIPWNPAAIGVWNILSAEGDVSDTIITYMDDANRAHLDFYSDPIPEPGTLALLGMGFLGLIGLRRSEKAN